MSSKWEFKKLINCIAYFALMFAAIAFTVGRLIPAASAFLMPIASLFAFAVASVSAFYYAKSKRSAVWMVLFIIAAIVVLVLLFLSAIGK